MLCCCYWLWLWRIRGHWSVRSCHPDNHAILTGGSGDVSPLPFHLLVNSFSSHIIHSIQILNVSTGPIFLPMVLNVHWNKVSQNFFQFPTCWGAKEIEVMIMQCYWWVTTAGSRVPDLMFVMSTSVFQMWGREAGERGSSGHLPSLLMSPTDFPPRPQSSAQLQRGCNLIW